MNHILITGASGGLGHALANHYARAGVRLTLWGRNNTKLYALAAQCQASGAQTQTRSVDLINITDAQSALIAEDTAHPIDLAIFASGLGDIRADTDRVEDPALITRLGIVNFVAPATLSAALADCMVARGKGHIVLIGSAAAFHALPFAAAYSGTKAGLAQFSQALRLSLRGHGVGVTLVSPGFIDTLAGRTVPGPKPLMMQPDAVAARIAKAAQNKTAHLILPWPFSVLRLFDRLLPSALRDLILLSLTPPPRA